MSVSAVTGSSYSQSASLTARIASASISSALSSNFPLPGDITEAFAFRGTGIGGGSFSTATSAGRVNVGLRIDTVSVNGAAVPIPIPAALPLLRQSRALLGCLAGVGSVTLRPLRSRFKTDLSRPHLRRGAFLESFLSPAATIFVEILELLGGNAVVYRRRTDDCTATSW